MNFEVVSSSVFADGGFLLVLGSEGDPIGANCRSCP